jgi:hypothetical protein
MSLPMTQEATVMPQEWQNSIKRQWMEQEESSAWIRSVIANRTRL